MTGRKELAGRQAGSQSELADKQAGRQNCKGGKIGRQVGRNWQARIGRQAGRQNCKGDKIGRQELADRQN